MLGSQRFVHVHQQPRPHGVELPHVSEIAEISEEDVSIAEDRSGLQRIEQSASEGIGSLAREEIKKYRSNRRRKSGHFDDESPIYRARKTAKKMRHRRSDRQRPNHHP